MKNQVQLGEPTRGREIDRVLGCLGFLANDFWKSKPGIARINPLPVWI